MLAAAFSADGAIIVTFNVTNFPSERLAQYGVTAVHPDAFVLASIEAGPEEVVEVLRAQAASLRNPLETTDMLIRRLSDQGLSRSALACLPIAASLARDRRDGDE